MTEDDEFDQRANRRKVLHVRAVHNETFTDGETPLESKKNRQDIEEQAGRTSISAQGSSSVNTGAQPNAAPPIEAKTLTLGLFLEKCIHKSELQLIAEKMELSDRGNGKALIRRIVRGYERWLPDDKVASFVEALCSNADWRKMEDLCIEVVVSPRGRKRDAFNRLIELIPEVASRAKLGGHELTLQQFLRRCYDRKGLRFVAAKMELSETGTQAKLAHRIARGYEKWLPDYQIKGFSNVLYKRINRKKMKKFLIERGIPVVGGRRQRFDRLLQLVPEIGKRGAEAQKSFTTQ
jgi:hypothetical protein